MVTSPVHPTPGGTAAFAGRTVSRIGYGAMQLEKFQGDRAGGLALLRRAVELGVDHFDTADFYGDGFVNSLIREAVSPDEAVIVSKVGADPNPEGPLPLRPAQKPAELRASVEANLTSLGLERIPVVNLRRLEARPGLVAEGDQDVPLDDQLAEMVALRDEGKIGGIGLSAVGLDTLRRALPAGIVCVQNAYSLVSREFDDMLDVCTAEGIAWVPFFPLGGAFASVPNVVDEPAVQEAAASLGVAPSQVGLAWLLQHAPTVLLIPGTASVAHLEDNLRVGDVKLSPEIVAALDAVQTVSGDGTIA